MRSERGPSFAPNGPPPEHSCRTRLGLQLFIVRIFATWKFDELMKSAGILIPERGRADGRGRLIKVNRGRWRVQVNRVGRRIQVNRLEVLNRSEPIARELKDVRDGLGVGISVLTNVTARAIRVDLSRPIRSVTLIRHPSSS
jgi:hypothetical protein